MRGVFKLSLGVMILLCLILGLSGSSHAYTGKLEIPAEGTAQKITLTDGSTLVGQITEITRNNVKFQTGLGEISIAIDKISIVEEVSASKAAPSETAPPTNPAEVPVEPAKAKPVESKPAAEPEKPKTTAVSSTSTASSRQNWYPNPNLTRLFIGPTSRCLKAGKGYFYDLWIFFPGIAYGVTDNFMISGGVSVIPGVDHQLFYVMPKYGFKASKDLDMSLSMAVFSIWEKTFCFGLGGMTYGTEDQSITGALGVAFTNDKISEKPAAMFGGEYRMGRRVSLVGEAWFIPDAGDDGETGILGIGGVRLMGEQMTIDFGIAMPNDPDNNDDEGGDWLPYLDFVWNF
jgi:hypothetical protein